MNIAVVGAGALGVYYGQRLQAAGSDVTYIVREGRARQLNEYELSITSPFGNDACEQFSYTTDVSSIEAPDLVLVGVKGYHLEGALPQIKQLTTKGAYVLPVLNGIEHINRLRSYVGNEAVLGGLAFIIATLDEKGHVHHTSPFHRLVFGSLMKEQDSFCERFASLAKDAQIEAIHSSDVLYDMWKKYMHITAFSGITTATNEPIRVVQENKPTERTVRAVLTEMQQLANAYGIQLGPKEVDDTMNEFLSLDQEATSSMHQDRRKGHHLEVDHLQGGVLRLAEAKGVDMPVIETLYGILAPLESK